jgi:Siphovirus Gp157
MAALYQLVEQYRSLEALDASEDLPAEVIQDTLEGLTGELTVKATNVAKFILNTEAMAEAIENAADAMKERASRIRRRSESIRNYLKVNMQASGITKIEATEFVLSLKKNPPAVIVTDEASIPEAFKAVPTPPPPPSPRPDKTAIKKAIQAGVEVPGAHLEQNERLDIRI